MNRFYLCIFALAGMPALIYQVVWQRVLTLYFGVDIYSTTIAVGAFMLGLGIGSLVGGSAADRVRRPIYVYVGCELLIGCFGILSLPLFRVVGDAMAAQPLTMILPVKFGLLLVPAMLMGMTLPLMCRIVTDKDETIGGQLSALYGVNTLGAAVGAVIASYLLIGLWGLDGATYVAASLNLLAATLMFLAAQRQPVISPMAGRSTMGPTTDKPQENWSFSSLVMLSALSGFVGLGYEIVWYRLLACILHGTVYVFGTILCIYLLGIAAGSLASRRRIDQPDGVGRFALSQLVISGYALLFFSLIGYLSWLPGLRHAIAASTYTSFHPAPDLIEGHFSLPNLYSLLDIPVWVLAVLGVPTWCMGYGFPNLIRAGSRSVTTLGQSVGYLYFANIIGATLGTLVVGLLTLNAWGSERTLNMLIVLGLIPAMVWGMGRGVVGRRVVRLRWAGVSACLLVLSLVAFPRAGRIIQALHYSDFGQVDYVEAREDRTGVVVLKRQREVISFSEEQLAVGTYRLYIDGASHGSMQDLDTVTLDEDVSTTALAVHTQPRRVLCIGLGDGHMAATVAEDPRVEELIIVELNASLRHVLARTAQGRVLQESPKVRFVVDDGRRWLITHPEEQFDLILMWPLHAAHAHSGSLFSHEFLTLCRSRLNDTGLLFLRTVDAYSTAKTIADVFPEVLRFDGMNYLASNHPMTDAKHRVSGRIARPVAADRAAIVEHTNDAPLLRDFAPRTEYYITYPWRRFLSSRNPAQDTLYRSAPE